jgi:hypothetical protein
MVIDAARVCIRARNTPLALQSTAILLAKWHTLSEDL